MSYFTPKFGQEATKWTKYSVQVKKELISGALPCLLKFIVTKEIKKNNLRHMLCYWILLLGSMGSIRFAFGRNNISLHTTNDVEYVK